MAFDKRGVAPADPSTDIGLFRFSAGDSEYEEYDPPEPGFALYQLWSDADIIGLLAAAGGSVPRAVSLAYAQIGASFATSGATIKTDDLSVSAKDSVGNWLALSKFWKDVADEEAARAVDDYFEMTPVRETNYWRKPEAAPWPYSREYPFIPGGNDTPSSRDGLDGGTP